jgi:hypothetical protein
MGKKPVIGWIGTFSFGLALAAGCESTNSGNRQPFRPTPTVTRNNTGTGQTGVAGNNAVAGTQTGAGQAPGAGTTGLGTTGAGTTGLGTTGAGTTGLGTTGAGTTGLGTTGAGTTGLGTTGAGTTGAGTTGLGGFTPQTSSGAGQQSSFDTTSTRGPSSVSSPAGYQSQAGQQPALPDTHVSPTTDMPASTGSKSMGGPGTSSGTSLGTSYSPSSSASSALRDDALGASAMPPSMDRNGLGGSPRRVTGVPMDSVQTLPPPPSSTSPVDLGGKPVAPAPPAPLGPAPY